MSEHESFSPTFIVLGLLMIFVCSVELLQEKETPKDAYVLCIYSRLKEGKQVNADEYHQLQVSLHGIPEREAFENKHSLKKGETTQLLKAKYLIQLASPWVTLPAEATTTVELP